VKALLRVAMSFCVAVMATGWMGRRCAADVGDGVTATGRATLNVTPDRLRVRVRITSTDRDTRQAVADLDQRRDAVEQALADLSPVAGTLSAGATHTSAGPQSSQDRLEILLMAGGGADRAAATQPSPSVTCVVQAEWDLSAHGSDEAVVNAAALGDRIRSAVAHAGQPTTQPATTAPATAPAATTEASDTSVEEDFQYVHAVSESERTKLLATATERATAEAKRLAEVAGFGLGPARRMSAASAGRTISDDAEPIGDYLRTALGEPDTANAEPAEAVGSDPGAVSFTVEVTATFALSPPK